MEVSQFFFTLSLFDPNVSVGTLLSNVTPEGFPSLTTKRSGSCIFADGTRLNSEKSFCYSQRYRIA
jgi:hypothetical protein